MRSGAPGPAPMKCTVMARLRSRRARRSPVRRRCAAECSRAFGPPAASAAASATDGTPASAITRADQVAPRAPASRDRAAPRRPARGHGPQRRRQFPPRRSCAADVAIDRCAPAGRPARSSAVSIAASISAADAPLRQPIPADDHGFTHTHCVTGSAGRHAVLPPTRSAREMSMRVSVPPSAAWRAISSGLGLQRHRIDHQPPAGPERRNCGIEHARRRLRRRRRTPRPASAGRQRLPARCLRRLRAPGTPNAAALRRMRAGAIGARLDRHRAHRGMGEQPLDGDRARACADVPQQLAPERRQRGQRHRADLALGDLAVMLEQIVGETRREGDARARRARPRPRSRRC